jgi:hypothetical protein
MSSSIKNLFLLYSNYSPYCSELLSSFPIDRYFHLLNIDNVEIRKSILTSKKIQITIVPCIFILYIDGTVQVFEGINKCLEVIKGVIPQRRPLNDSQKTPISSIIKDEVKFQEPLKVEDESENEEENNEEPEEEIDEEEIIKTKKNNILKEKLGRNRGLNSNIPRPKMGDGHENMMLSSIPDKIKTQKKEFVELENLDEALNEVESQPRNFIKNSKKSLEETRQKIDEMSKEREQLLKSEDEKRDN